MKHVHSVIQRTDWTRLQDQKLALLKHLGGNDLDPTHELYGLVNWMDCIQDAVVEDGLQSEHAVFG